VKEFLTISDIAKLLGVSDKQVQRHVLPAVEHVKIGALYRVSASRFAEWLERSTRPARLATMRRAERRAMKVQDYVNSHK
jgi:excisionase family DNA binding protein